MAIPYTAGLTAVLALGLIGLSLNISRLRLRYKVSLGDGGHKDLLAAIRVHGNTLEQALLGIALLACMELMPDVSRPLVAGLAAAFIVARLAYCAGVFGRWIRLRQLAHIVTIGLQALAAAVILRGFA